MHTLTWVYGTLRKLIIRRQLNVIYIVLVCWTVIEAITMQ